ncbi:MAG: hypothetical protein SNJ74_04625 [Fimbriimonadaceae bacterium]
MRATHGIWAVAFAGLSIALVVAVFAIVGTPADMARYRRDSQRVADLLRFASELREQTRSSGHEPAKPLPDRVPDRLASLDVKNDWIDPLTRQPYRYRKIDEDRFELCATFEMSSEQFERRGRRLPDDRWRHGAGERCIVFDRTDFPTDYWPYQG